jgi:GDP-4-dehydro-6-deoxy-D-mannose reductase
MKHVLITGAAGFVGRWSSAAFVERGYEVTALATDMPDTDATIPGVPSFSESISWHIGDLRDDDYVREVVARTSPDYVVHLAAISHLPTAAANPTLAWDVNVTATARLIRELELSRAAGKIDPLVLIIGSAEQYGRVESGNAIREEMPQRPRTVYASTKAAQELLALQSWRASGIRVIVTRSFNHSGPGQEERFLIPALVRRSLALRENNSSKVLALGNTSPVRDVLHVKDVVNAYIALCERGVPGESYNVAGGEGRSVRQIAERVLSLVGVEAELYEDPAMVRPVDVPYLVGDSTKLQFATGWQAQHSFDDIVNDLITAAR